MKQENGEGSTGDQQDLEPTSDELATTKMTALLNLKKGQWEAIKKKTGPLRVLDLPVDILRLIVKEASQIIYRVPTKFAYVDLPLTVNVSAPLGHLYKQSELPCYDQLHTL